MLWQCMSDQEEHCCSPYIGNMATSGATASGSDDERALVHGLLKLLAENAEPRGQPIQKLINDEGINEDLAEVITDKLIDINQSGLAGRLDDQFIGEVQRQVQQEYERVKQQGQMDHEFCAEECPSPSGQPGSFGPVHDVKMQSPEKKNEDMKLFHTLKEMACDKDRELLDDFVRIRPGSI